MDATLRVGDRVEVSLDSNYWKNKGWFKGTVARIDPYSKNRNFYWVRLDAAIETSQGSLTDLIAVLNPKKIKRTNH
jgi:hypothetical protein